MKFKTLNVHFWLIGIAWTIIIGFVIFNELSNQEKYNDKIINSFGEVSYQKDLMYRRWVSIHGGVYVPITKYAVPNPYLTFIDNREIFTKNNDSLTLINPAYMTRQVYELKNENYKINARLISLNPINPINKPDSLERIALNNFENGDSIYTQKVKSNNNYILKYIRPFKTEKVCLKCHQHQGYKVGDIRGAISIEVPLETFEESMTKDRNNSIITNIIIWLLGIFGIISSFSILKTQVNARNKAEEKISKQKDELEVSHSELLAKTDELVKINEELNIANNTKNKFFSVLAHDLKSPFNSILGLSELFITEYDILDIEQRKLFIKTINEDAKLTYKLLENLLLWANSQQDSIQLHFKKIELSDLIYEISTLYYQSAENKKISINTDIDANHVIIADHNTISTIFRNLLSNAIKFTHKGGMISIVSKEVTINNDKYIDIKISDSGVGISESNINKLFNIESTDSTPGTEEEKGTGFGLIIVKEFIEKNNGFISVNSEVGKGTTFSVKIPSA